MLCFKKVPFSLPLQKHWLVFSNAYRESLADPLEVILMKLRLDFLIIILLYIIFVVTGGFSFSRLCVNSFCNKTAWYTGVTEVKTYRGLLTWTQFFHLFCKQENILTLDINQR